MLLSFSCETYLSVAIFLLKMQEHISFSRRHEAGE